jgi:hypothetical protein
MTQRLLQRYPCIMLELPAGVAYWDAERGFGVVIPDRLEWDHVCAWCYGRPMPGMETCSRTSCITNWNAVQVMHMGWRI